MNSLLFLLLSTNNSRNYCNMAQEITILEDLSLMRFIGYIDAKIEDCKEREPVPQEISAWEEMKKYIDSFILVQKSM